jgi:hypothetical protein
VLLDGGGIGDSLAMMLGGDACTVEAELDATSFCGCECAQMFDCFLHHVHDPEDDLPIIPEYLKPFGNARRTIGLRLVRNLERDEYGGWSNAS